MTNRSIARKPPPLGLPVDRYVAIAHVVLSVLDPAGLAGVALMVDELATDELHQAFDTRSERYPWRL